MGARTARPVNLPVEILALVIVLAIVGGMVQGIIGFGMGVVVSPILALLRPELVPVAVVLAAALLPVISLVDEWRHLDWRRLGWILLARLPGTALGAWIVVAIPLGALQVVIALIVLAMVVLNLVRIRVPLNAGTLVGAGFISGVSGTAAGIGGPPLAIVLAEQDPRMVRPTLAASFMVGVIISLGALAVGGAVRSEALIAGLAMVPATATGMLVARRVRDRLSSAGFRIGVLGLSSVSAVLLLLQGLG